VDAAANAGRPAVLGLTPDSINNEDCLISQIVEFLFTLPGLRSRDARLPASRKRPAQEHQGFPTRGWIDGGIWSAKRDDKTSNHPGNALYALAVRLTALVSKKLLFRNRQSQK